MNPTLAIHEATADGWAAAATVVSPTGQERSALAWSRAAFACALGLVLLGLVVLLGWALDIGSLTSVLPGRASMKANTALAFLSCGASLAVRLWPALGAGRPAAGQRNTLGAASFALLVFILGFGSLLEYLLHTSFGMDQLLFQDHEQLLYPGRMAVITSLNFTLVGSALLLLGGGRRSRFAARALAIVVLLSAYASIVGYLYGVPVLYGGIADLGYVSMAVHTGASFLVVSLAMLLAEPESKVLALLSDEPAGAGLRLLLPILLILPILLGRLYLQLALSFGGARFGMALLAVTLAAVGTGAVWATASIQSRAEKERRELAAVRAASNAAVERSERELRLVTDHLPALLSYIDRHGRLIRVNRTYETWHGRPAAEIVGRSIGDLLGRSYFESTRLAREQAFAGQTVTLETLYPAAGGERQAVVTYSPDFDAEGNVRGLACMVLDVDEQRKAEAALRQSEKLAVVGRLASSIAHEINNPLEAVTNLLYLAEQETATHPTAAEYVSTAQRELARVTQIVTQTLRFQRQTTQTRACRLGDLLDQVLVLYGGRLTGLGVSVLKEFGDDNPVLCREGEIRQVMANLVGNAVDAMPRGGQLRLRVHPARNARTGLPGVLFVVADTGHGIPPDVRRRLYEPFQTTKGEKGSGLGLWVSKEIIERHNGTMRVRSSTRDEASGTVFRIWLPAA